jgi:hypothetical protein
MLLLAKLKKYGKPELVLEGFSQDKLLTLSCLVK